MVVVIDATVETNKKELEEMKMTTLKGWISTTCLVAMLMVSTMTANAGIIVGGATGDTCTEVTKDSYKGGIIVGGLTGIIVGGLTGIIVGGLTGIIVGGAADTPTQNCGIIVGG